MKLQQLLQDPNYKKKFVLEKLLCHFLSKTREELWIQGDIEIAGDTLEKIQKAYREYVEEEKPLEYILGYVEFFGVRFWVNEQKIRLSLQRRRRFDEESSGRERRKSGGDVADRAAGSGRFYDNYRSVQ